MEQTSELDVKGQIEAILAVCSKANPFGTKSQKEADETFWRLVKELDRKAKDGQHPVMPGRFVRLPAKDSYAYYIVTRVTKKTVKLIHVPYGSKYEATAARDGEAELHLIETTLSWYDKIDSRFDELGKQAFQDTTEPNDLPPRRPRVQ